MGISTDGLLIYGVAMPEDIELPWDQCDEEDWWIKETGFKASFYPFTEDGKGYAEGVSNGDPRIDAYFNEQSDWMEEHPFPVEIHTHCSGEYPMFIVAPHNCKISASRGNPEIDVYSKMTALITPDMRERRLAAREFLKKYVDPLNIDNSDGDGEVSKLEFSWILASHWN